MDIDLDLIKRRMVVLLRQLDVERGYGWQTELARQVWGDIRKQSHINQMLNEKKGAGIKTAQEIAKGMSLSMRFFTDPSLGDAPDYRAWCGPQRPPQSPTESRTILDEPLPADWEAQVQDFLRTSDLNDEQKQEFLCVRRSIGIETSFATLTELARDVRRKIPDRAIADTPRSGVTFDVMAEIEKKER